MKPSLLVLLFLTLSACGWQLRGEGSTKQNQLSPAYALIEVGDLDDLVLKNEVRLALAQSGITIMRDAPALLQIQKLNLTSVISMFDNRGVASEYETTGEISAVVSHDSYAKQTLTTSVTKRYQYDADQEMASDKERQELQKQIKRLLAQRLIDLIIKLEPQPASEAS